MKYGFWEERGSVFQLVGYLEDQPSASDTEKTRELYRARQRRQRQHRMGDHSLCDPDYCRAAAKLVTRDETRDSRVTQRETNATPSRPVPSRPDL